MEKYKERHRNETKRWRNGEKQRETKRGRNGEVQRERGRNRERKEREIG